MTQGIIITGAGSGIGRTTARLFLSRGWRVALLGRRAPPLEETAAGHPDALILPCDVTDEAGVRFAFDRARRDWGRIDALFNNAGQAASLADPDRLPVDVFRKVIDTNVTGMFICAAAAFAVMRDQTPQGGRIINNGSVAAHSPRAQSVAYTVSKHAVTGLTRSLSLDGRSLDIACGQIDIGNASTELLRQAAAQDPDAEPTMDVSTAADSVWHMANLPPGANIQFMTIMATAMPFIGRG
ncbi:SDR family oxidoreductase [Paracoccus beibuensis]|uniref:SDR family oxidoreductase n=1 Tax=Paracoccus beibuensis TaxID=547602 RepID=UPI002240AE0B|nr:SDR family oxidoreductase [Paracoccus beibuensis]